MRNPHRSLRYRSFGAWLLASSVLTLAVAIVLSLGFPSEIPESPVSAVLSAGLLYVGFFLIPVALAVVAARHRGLRTVLALGFSPLAQTPIAAVLTISARSMVDDQSRALPF